MIHQTSGFRDFIGLIRLSGHDRADFNSPEEIFKIVVRQKGLNNIPGEGWIFSNTNYFLLGMVVKRTTKKSLSEFAAENIFQPLHAALYDPGSPSAAFAQFFANGTSLVITSVTRHSHLPHQRRSSRIAFWRWTRFLKKSNSAPRPLMGIEHPAGI